METPPRLTHSSRTHITALPNNQLDMDEGHALAQAIVDTVRKSLLVLDADLCVVSASRSFYATFKTDRENVEGTPRVPTGRWPVERTRASIASR